MKKLLLIIAAVLMTVSAQAQFEKGKFYTGASLTSLDLSYNGIKDLNLGVNAHAGYFFADELMGLAQVEYDHSGDKSVKDYFMAGVGGRYYIVQNGLYLGVNAKYIHNGSYNDIMPGLEVGYAFFVSRTVTIEPAVYYDQSFKNHSDYSTIGFKVGVGIYLGKD